MKAIFNTLTIDVEDYFHVSAFEQIVNTRDWERYELRVDRNVHKLLSILDDHETKATFFVLGWVARRCPGLIKAIARAGHEIASHGFRHRRIGTQSQMEFREDIRASKMLLEDLTGSPVRGYRAPSYSITRETPWAFDELCSAGYCYDSSIFPIRHDLYGISEWPRFAGWAGKIPDKGWCPLTPAEACAGAGVLFEIPITTLSIAGKNVPIAGGGYFRLLPYDVTHWGLKRINRVEGRPFVFYIHPWEFDPDQPRILGIGMKSRFRHYLNLERTEGRFRRLLNDFCFASISEVFGNQLDPLTRNLL